MADPSAVYTLTPPVGSPIVFNNGNIGDGTDLYWLSDITGVDEADVRAPRFRKPVTDGANVLRRYEDGLLPVVEGMYLVQSVPQNQCMRIRNQMRWALLACLRACKAAAGTLTWAEAGIVGSFSLEVFYEVKLTHTYESDYHVMTFTFGLASEASAPTGP